jgi:hypothetical protein
LSVPKREDAEATELFTARTSAGDTWTQSGDIESVSESFQGSGVITVVDISRDSNGRAGFRYFAETLEISYIDEARPELCNMRVGDVIQAVNGEVVSTDQEYEQETKHASQFCLTLARIEAKESEWVSRQTLASYADAVRASGSCANIVGTAAPALHTPLAPFSVVGGAVGSLSGAKQFYNGISTPSGVVDPHLVTKGAIATGVGASCMVLGAAAAAFPPFFAVALGLGVTGLAAATTVDIFMDGLCDECREQRLNDICSDGSSIHSARSVMN